MALDLDIAYGATASGAIHEPDHRQAQVMRHLLGVDQLVAHGAVIGAAAYREVVADQHHRAPAHLRAAHHEVRRHQVHQPAVAVVAAAAAQTADFAERARVGNAGNALVHGQLARFAVARHLVFAAHARGKPAAIGQFINFGLPGHGASPVFSFLGLTQYRTSHASPKTLAEPLISLRIF